MKINETYTDYEGFGFYPGGDNTPLDQDVSHAALYHWIFHFNEYTGLWNAVHRDHYHDYWSNRNFGGVISSRNIGTLVELVKKTNGDPEKIEKLVGDQS